VAIPDIQAKGDGPPTATAGKAPSSEAWGEFLQGGWLVTGHSRGATVRTLVAWSVAGLPRADLVTADELLLAGLRARAQPVKAIAADTGRSASRVAEIVHSAMRKLRLETEPELVGFFAAWPDAMVVSRVVHGRDRCLALTYETPRWTLPLSLSPAERRVAMALLAGGSHAAVARACGVAPRTVANHIAALHRKLGVHSRIELFVLLSRARAP
jgi:DNA-binding NarL/FixJ family response regulator